MGERDLLSKQDILQLVGLREILAGFSHEIAQPLNAMMIASQVIQLRVQRTDLSDDDKAFLVSRLEIVSSQVQRATKIVNNFRAFANPGKKRAGEVTIKDAFESVHALIGQQFVGRGIELAWDHADRLPPLVTQTHTVKLVLVQGLAFSRDAAEAVAQWHDRSELACPKSVTVRLLPANGGSGALMTWKTGEMPAEKSALDYTQYPGLEVAESVLVSLGGAMSTTPNSILMIFT